MTLTFILSLIINIAVSQSAQINYIGLKSGKLKKIMANQECDFYFDKELELKKIDEKINEEIDEENLPENVIVLKKKNQLKPQTGFIKKIAGEIIESSN